MKKLIIVLIVLLAIIGGYYVYNDQQDRTKAAKGEQIVLDSLNKVRLQKAHTDSFNLEMAKIDQVHDRATIYIKQGYSLDSAMIKAKIYIDSTYQSYK